MKYILFITVLIILTGCAGNSPEIYQSGDSKTCSYDKIQGKSFKYTGEMEYIDLYFKYDPNVEFEPNIPINYNSIKFNNFKILQTGLITEYNIKHNREPMFANFRYNEDIIGEYAYKYDSGYSTKIVTADCKIYYLNKEKISEYKKDIKNSDNTELNGQDLLDIIGEKPLKKLEFESDITYDKFTKVNAVTTPYLNNMAIRGNFSNKEVKFIQLYTNLYFIDKWGFVKNAVDTNGVYHDVTKISTDTSCSNTGCTLTETIGIDLSLDFLKNNQNGFEIKAFGTREKIINVPSVMIKSFLKAAEIAKNK